MGGIIYFLGESKLRFYLDSNFLLSMTATVATGMVCKGLLSVGGRWGGSRCTCCIVVGQMATHITAHMDTHNPTT